MDRVNMSLRSADVCIDPTTRPFPCGQAVPRITAPSAAVARRRGSAPRNPRPFVPADGAL